MEQYDTNVDACNASLEDLDKAGRISRADAARVKAVRTLAAVLDKQTTNSQLYREYREAWRELVGSDDGGDDTSDVLAAIRNAP